LSGDKEEIKDQERSVTPYQQAVNNYIQGSPDKKELIAILMLI
jgi:hypothetical protein